MESALRFLIDHFPYLMDINLTASIVIVFVICVRRFMKKAPKIFSYALWGIVLLRLLVPISIESPMSFVPERTEFSSMVEVNEVLPEIHFETPQDRADNEWYRENTPPGQPLAQVGRFLTAQDYLTFVWLFGIAVMLLYSFVSYWKLRRRLKVIVPYRKGIFIADDIDSPFVMGVFCPTIYLPGSLEPWERTFIIAHERHHIRRGDHVFKALGFLALSIHWFNPFVWVAFALAGRDMEMSCDEAVIRRMGEDVRADYSAALLNLATGHRMFAGTPLAFGEGDPTGRVRNLAKWKKPTIWIVVICVVLCAVLAVCLLTDPEIKRPMEMAQTIANTTHIVLFNDPLPDGYFEGSDREGNIVFSNGDTIVGGVLGYSIPEGLYDPDEHIEALLYKMGIPDYMDPSLYFRGGMTSGENGWLAEYESTEPEGKEPTVYRRHHFYPIEGIVYDIWFDMTLLDYETTEEIRVRVNLPTEGPVERKDWGLTLTAERVSRTGAHAIFTYGGSIPGEEAFELTYDDLLTLDRLENGTWSPVEELPGYEYYVGDSRYPVSDGYGMVHEWQDRFGELPDGHYRIGKRVVLQRPDGSMEDRFFYGTFHLPDSIQTGLIPMDKLPKMYSAEQAMIDGCYVQVDGVARENKAQFEEFVLNTWNGIPGVIRLYNCSYQDSFTWSVMDLNYDGNVYTLVGQENTYTFRFLNRFTGEKAWENADHSAYEYYVLVNDNSVTWEDIASGKLDMRDWQNPAHWTIYADFAYAPMKPQIPANLKQAILEFNGEPLVTTTDFDRLEKLYILFSDAEFLGYEPKTHSIGIGLNLILQTHSGESLTIELDPDSDICRINGAYIFYGAYDEPSYIEKLWYYLDIPFWPDAVYEKYPNAFRNE